MTLALGIAIYFSGLWAVSFLYGKLYLQSSTWVAEVIVWPAVGLPRVLLEFGKQRVEMRRLQKKCNQLLDEIGRLERERGALAKQVISMGLPNPETKTYRQLA